MTITQADLAHLRTLINAPAKPTLAPSPGGSLGHRLHQRWYEQQQQQLIEGERQMHTVQEKLHQALGAMRANDYAKVDFNYASHTTECNQAGKLSAF